MSDGAHTTVTTQQRDRLIEIFIQWNEKINLSAIRTHDDIYNKHILDSIELNKVVDIATATVLWPDQSPLSYNGAKKITLLDLWTGGWFPLLPLAMTNPTVTCAGLDSTRKKLTAVQAIADELGLKNISTVRSRAEDHHKKYNVVTIRAVGYADRLFPWALPLLAENGLLCIYKLWTKQEDDLILSLVRSENLTLAQLHHYNLPWDDYQRIIYVLKKN